MQRILILAASLLTLVPPASAAPASIIGRWTTDDGNAIVEITSCGAKLCGRIQRFLSAEPAGGMRDRKNPDAAKRDRKLVGAPVLWNLSGSGESWKGQGYSPRDGRNFSATVSTTGRKLNIKGCVTLFCRTVVWTRAE